jgi:hypothetical protein
MEGAQYLHEPIPIATRSEGFRVAYELRGTVAAYREKVYGPNYRGTTSPEDLTDSHLGYDIRETYDWLWDTYGKYVVNSDLTPAGAAHEVMHWGKPDLCISTVPAQILCEVPEHSFTSQQIWSSGDFPVAVNSNTVVCNGEKAPAWYRAASIHGHVTVEWPSDSKPPIPGLHSVVKPLSNTCTCLPGIVRMGRYGRWEKGVLSHTAFYETAKLLLEPQQLEMPL